MFRTLCFAERYLEQTTKEMVGCSHGHFLRDDAAVNQFAEMPPLPLIPGGF